MKILPKRSNPVIRKKIFIETIVAFAIVVSPYIFYLYEYVPDGITKTTIFGITINAAGFNGLGIAVWVFLLKFVPFYLLIIWFITCKHWWYHAILIPICMYGFQIFSTVNKDSKYIDEKEIIWLIPVMMVVIPIVYWIRIKLFDKYVHGIDLEEIEKELKEYEEKGIK